MLLEEYPAEKVALWMRGGMEIPEGSTFQMTDTQRYGNPNYLVIDLTKLPRRHALREWFPEPCKAIRNRAQRLAILGEVKACFNPYDRKSAVEETRAVVGILAAHRSYHPVGDVVHGDVAPVKVSQHPDGSCFALRDSAGRRFVGLDLRFVGPSHPYVKRWPTNLLPRVLFGDYEMVIIAEAGADGVRLIDENDIPAATRGFCEATGGSRDYGNRQTTWIVNAANGEHEVWRYQTAQTHVMSGDNQGTRHHLLLIRSRVEGHPIKPLLEGYWILFTVSGRADHAVIIGRLEMSQNKAGMEYVPFSWPEVKSMSAQWQQHLKQKEEERRSLVEVGATL